MPLEWQLLICSRPITRKREKVEQGEVQKFSWSEYQILTLLVLKAATPVCTALFIRSFLNPVVTISSLLVKKEKYYCVHDEFKISPITWCPNSQQSRSCITSTRSIISIYFLSICVNPKQNLYIIVKAETCFLNWQTSPRCPNFGSNKNSAVNVTLALHKPPFPFIYSFGLFVSEPYNF